ncbi:hypothetical protein ASD08_46095 [Streptomyces sp. Root369]|nr:hypothetical protein ASD08_46095 [Streptomyces sp. Root369]
MIRLNRRTGGNTALMFTNHSFYFAGGVSVLGVAVCESNHALEPRTLLRSVWRAKSAALMSQWVLAAESSQARAVPSLAKR